MIELVIVDDNEVIASHLAKDAAAHPRAAELHIITLHSGLELRKHVASGTRIDILLTDIQLGEEENGIELVDELFGIGSATQIIYATGFTEYCTPVYRTPHISFLLKPYRIEDFNESLDRAIDSLAASKAKPISIKTANGIVAIDPKRILYVESSRHNLNIHTVDGVFRTYSTLAKLLEILPDYFFSCHKSFAVNLNMVGELNANGFLLRDRKTLIPVSQARRKASKEAFTAFLCRQL